VLRSLLDTSTAGYTAAAAAMTAKLAEIDAEHAKALGGGGPEKVKRHRTRGKLTARERIELLLDEDSPFLELCPLAAWGSDFAVGASIVTGIGVVEDVECLVVSRTTRPCAAAPATRGRCGSPSGPTTSPGRTGCR
jgi:acetyl-CoA carboxylase carboxyltransferase component